MKPGQLRGRVPLEPLDDERLVRLERAVVSGAPAPAPPRARRSTAAWWLIGATLVMAAAVGLWLARRPAAPDRDRTVAGHGVPAPVALTPSADGAPVVVVAGAGGAHVDLGDARIDATPMTSLTATRPDGGVLVELTVGSVELDVDKRGARPPLVVRAGDVDVVVVGTHFTVRRPADGGPVEVDVREGLVQVVRGAVTTAVAAGQAWSATTGQVVALDRRTTAPPAPTIAAATTDKRPVRAAGSANGGGSGARPAVAGSGDAGDLGAAIRRQPVAAGIALGSATPAAALAMLRQRVTAHGEEAAAALYGMARLQALTLGKTDDALRSIDAYVRRFPRGAEIEDALWLRVRIECRTQTSEACRVAAHSYLRAAPSGSAKAELATRVTRQAS